MSIADSATERDEFLRLEEDRSRERKRWFQHVLVMPISIGMIVSVGVSAFGDIFVKSIGPSGGLPSWFSKLDAILSVASAVLVLVCAIFFLRPEKK